MVIKRVDNMRISSSALSVLALSACSLIPPVDVPPAAGGQSQMVVFDIDGTLTPRDIDVYEPRPSAADAVNAHLKKGYSIVYVTTRIPAFQSKLKSWLDENGFPPGILHVAQTGDERANPADYKAGILERYVTAGWTIAYAYGDSTTDFVAYAKVKIPKDRVFALKRRGEADCQPQPSDYKSCLDGWSAHLRFIETEVAQAR